MSAARSHRRRRLLWALAIVVVVLVGARLALPGVVKDYVNRQLQALESYDGRVADVDIALWRGAYAANGVVIRKTGFEDAEPFFAADRIDFAVEWRSLVRGRVVAEADFIRPTLNFVQAQVEEKAQTGAGENWAAAIEKLFPFRFNTVEVADGTVTFRAPGIGAEDALTARNLDGMIANITNVARSDQKTFASFGATATVLESGTARVNGNVDPLADEPTFDVDLTVKDVHLPEVNPWLDKFIKADAESGDFELYTELAAADGRFEGYAKPIMRNVEIFSTAEDADNPLRKLWEGIVAFAAEIVEDQDTDQVAARIPFSGPIEDPEAGVFATVVSVLRNAFVSAFARSLEGSITLRDVKENLEGIGEGKEKQAQDGKKEKDDEEPV